MAGRDREGRGRMRLLLAQTCARIMTEEGVNDYLVAKRKAAQRLGVTIRTLMPSNVEIEAALAEYQRLFLANARAAQLESLRQGAIKAMRFFERFRPRLVGSVLAGSVGLAEEVQLHLFADMPEEFELYLMQYNIPYDAGVRRLRVGSRLYAFYPTYGFGAGDVNFQITVFPSGSEREAPLSPIDGRPMRRVTLKELEALLFCG